jgi:hypothetical protein
MKLAAAAVELDLGDSCALFVCRVVALQLLSNCSNSPYESPVSQSHFAPHAPYGARKSQPRQTLLPDRSRDDQLVKRIRTFLLHIKYRYNVPVTPMPAHQSSMRAPLITAVSVSTVSSRHLSSLLSPLPHVIHELLQA